MLLVGDERARPQWPNLLRQEKQKMKLLNPRRKLQQEQNVSILFVFVVLQNPFFLFKLTIIFVFDIFEDNSPLKLKVILGKLLSLQTTMWKLILSYTFLKQVGFSCRKLSSFSSNDHYCCDYGSGENEECEKKEWFEPREHWSNCNVETI